MLGTFLRGWCCHSSRHYVSLSPLRSRRGFREKDETPGSEAIFNEELKKMKDVVGQGLDPELEDDAVQQREALQKMTQDFSKRSSAMTYARRAKYLGTEREKRLLTWDNIDKIRYLKQEHPEEWSIPQLAASFEVSEMAIKKVLKSKYTPNSKTRTLQDMLVLNNTGREKKLKPSVEKSIVLDAPIQKFDSSVSSPQNNDYSFPTGDSNIIIDQEIETTDTVKKMNMKEKISKTDEQDSEGDEDDWDDMSDASLEEELEEEEAFSSLTPSDFVKVFEEGATPPKIIQKGKEFYDTDGEFLFRI